jgi:hypothetical protein
MQPQWPPQRSNLALAMRLMRLTGRMITNRRECDQEIFLPTGFGLLCDLYVLVSSCDEAVLGRVYIPFAR